jgi:GNAT superfamily N-acetyltransferase
MTPKPSKKLLLELEELVVDAWPAAETEPLDGWLLRASGGPTHRGNSTSTLACDGGLALDERLSRAEAFYRERGLPPMFQIGPCVEPIELDSVLAERGYRVSSEALMATAPALDVLARTRARHQVEITTRPSEAFATLTAAESRFAESYDSFRGFLHRLGSRCRYVTARDATETTVAACITIASEERIGVYAMLTARERRREGAATSLLHAIAAHAHSDLARELYLLVETGNEAARATYAKAGFADVYGYHYRVA